MSQDIQSMIDSLAAAKLAMEENPSLKLKVKELEDEIYTRMERHNALSSEHTDLVEKHSFATDRIAELEAALEQARFRELATRQTLEKLVSGVSEAISEVAPPSVDSTEPEPVVVDEPATILAQATETAGETAQPNTQTKMVEHDFNRQFEPDWHKPTLTEVDPTQDSEFGQGPKSSEPDIDPPAPFQPYAGRHYSMKPTEMPWPRWIDLGGQAPWWLTATELEKLRAGSVMAS